MPAGKLVVGTGADGKACHRIYPGEAAVAGSTVRDSIIADANPRRLDVVPQHDPLQAVHDHGSRRLAHRRLHVGHDEEPVGRGRQLARLRRRRRPIRRRRSASSATARSAAGNIAPYIELGTYREAARGQPLVPGAEALGATRPRARHAHRGPGPQPRDEVPTIGASILSSTTSATELQPLHRPRAVSRRTGSSSSASTWGTEP